MANGTAVVVKGKREAKQRETERALRRSAMEPIRLALHREGRPATWLMRQLASRANLRVSQSTLYNYLSGYARVPRGFVQSACLIAGANYGDVCARVAGNETVLFQAGFQSGK